MPKDNQEANQTKAILDVIEDAINSGNFTSADVIGWISELKTLGLYQEFSYLIAQAEDKLKAELDFDPSSYHEEDRPDDLQ